MCDLIILNILAFLAIKMLLVIIKVSAPFYSSQITLLGLPPVAMYSVGQIYIAYLSLYRTLWSTNEVSNFTNLMRARFPSDLISTSSSLQDDEGRARMPHDARFISLCVLYKSLSYRGHKII